MPPSPIIAQIGPLALRWYSLMIVLGAVVASFLATREARRRGQDPEHVWQLLPLVLILGIIGARLGWVLVSLGEIQAKGGWEHAFYVWEGGLSIQGALVGGIVGAIIYTVRHRLDFFEWADIAIPGVALAQAIGRWGNYFNQEAFGAPCDQPWCIPISNEVLQSHPEYADYVGKNLRFAPTFAYEMIWDLLNFALLMWLGRQRRFELRTGDLLWVYGIFYSVGRFFIEEVRVDSAIVFGLKFPEVIALLTIIICFAGLIYRHRPGSTAPVAVVAATDADLAEDTEAAAESDAADWDEDEAPAPVVAADEPAAVDEWEEDESAPDGVVVANGEYAVTEDEVGTPVEPVPHPVPVVAQAQPGEDDPPK